MQAWASMYDGHYDLVWKWFEEQAPDEHGELNMLDLFRYMIKLQCYMIQKKHLAVVALTERLKPLLRRCRRTMDLCEMNFIEAMSAFMNGEKEQAFELMDEVVEGVGRYGFYRLLGDEGAPAHKLLLAYRRKRGRTEFLDKTIEIAKKAAVMYPMYLKQAHVQRTELTEREKMVLHLIAEEYSNAEIGEFMEVTLNTVKYYTKKIFGKLGVKTRGQAVKKARELGLMENKNL